MKEMKQQNTVGLFMEQKYKKQPTTMYKDTLSLSLTHTHTPSILNIVMNGASLT